MKQFQCKGDLQKTCFFNKRQEVKNEYIHRNLGDCSHIRNLQNQNQGKFLLCSKQVQAINLWKALLNIIWVNHSIEQVLNRVLRSMEIMIILTEILQGKLVFQIGRILRLTQKWGIYILQKETKVKYSLRNKI